MNYSYEEEINKELEAFATSTEEKREINTKLQQIIDGITITGVSCYKWEWLKELLITKLMKVLDAHNAKTSMPDFEQEKQRLCSYLRDFEEPPFTLQRLCELLVGPAGDAYKTTKAYAFAIEKVIYVTSTQSTLQPEEYNNTVVEYTRRMEEVKKSSDLDKNPRKRSNKPSEMELGSSPKKPSLIRTGTPTLLVSDDGGEKENENEKDHGSPSQKRGSVPTTTLGEGNDMMDVDKD